MGWGRTTTSVDEETTLLTVWTDGPLVPHTNKGGYTSSEVQEQALSTYAQPLLLQVLFD
jgi:hypothetical protein